MFNKSYNVKLEIFEGPMDLLLHLIKKNEVDVYDIPISIITEQYLEYVEVYKSLNLEMAGEYLVMAANLIHIKSKMLLPIPEEPDEEEEIDPRAELVRRLIEYKRFKEVAEALSEKNILGRDVFVRGFPFPLDDLEEAKEEPQLDLALMDLIEAFKDVLKKAPKDLRISFSVDKFHVVDKINHIMERINVEKSANFFSLFPVGASRGEIIVTFLAILELCKRVMVKVSQRDAQGGITLYLPDQLVTDAEGNLPEEITEEMAENVVEAVEEDFDDYGGSAKVDYDEDVEEVPDLRDTENNDDDFDLEALNRELDAEPVNKEEVESRLAESRLTEARELEEEAESVEEDENSEEGGGDESGESSVEPSVELGEEPPPHLSDDNNKEEHEDYDDNENDDDYDDDDESEEDEEDGDDLEEDELDEDDDSDGEDDDGDDSDTEENVLSEEGNGPAIADPPIAEDPEAHNSPGEENVLSEDEDDEAIGDSEKEIEDQLEENIEEEIDDHIEDAVKDDDPKINNEENSVSGDSSGAMKAAESTPVEEVQEEVETQEDIKEEPNLATEESINEEIKEEPYPSNVEEQTREVETTEEVSKSFEAVIKEDSRIDRALNTEEIETEEFNREEPEEQIKAEAVIEETITAPTTPAAIEEPVENISEPLSVSEPVMTEELQAEPVKEEASVQEPVQVKKTAVGRFFKAVTDTVKNIKNKFFGIFSRGRA